MEPVLVLVPVPKSGPGSGSFFTNQNQRGGSNWPNRVLDYHPTLGHQPLGGKIN